MTKKKKSKTRLKFGDIIEIAFDGKYAYAQYIQNEKIKNPGGVFLRIFSEIYTTRPDIAHILISDDLFQIFVHVLYEFEYSEEERLKIIANATVPEKYNQPSQLFKTYNDWPEIAGFTRAGREWFIKYLDGTVFPEDGESLKRFGSILPEEYHYLPTSQEIYYDELVEMIYAQASNAYDVHPKQREQQQEELPVPEPLVELSEPERLPSPRPNPIAKPLEKLLTRLDGIMEQYEELQDTDVREQLYEAVHNAFVLAKTDYVLSDGFGMFTKTGNKRVHSALATFLKKANDLAAKANLTSDQSRLAAFQDDEVTSENGSTYDDYFGDC